MELFATEDNPIPASATAMAVRTSDGITLRAARWRPTGRRSRGTVLVVQGRAEFIEKYFETIQDLRRRGFHVVAFDFRGQGGSQRLTRNSRKGHVRRFSDFGRDLDAVIAQVLEPHGPKPWFVLAHSMGGAVMLRAAHRRILPFRRMVLSAPLVDIHAIEGKTWPTIAAAVLKFTGFGASFIPGGGETSAMTRPFAGNELTRDAARYARNAEAAAASPQIAIGDPTVSWLWTTLGALRKLRAPRYPLEVTVPTLIVAAGADTVVSTPAIERFAARLKGGHAIVLPGARHELLQETEAVRSRFLAAFDAFVPGSDDASAIFPAAASQPGA